MGVDNNNNNNNRLVDINKYFSRRYSLYIYIKVYLLLIF